MRDVASTEPRAPEPPIVVDHPAPRRQAVVRVAEAVAVVSLSCVAAAVWIHLTSSSGATSLSPPDLVVGTAYPLLAVVVLRARPDHRAGHLLLTTGLLGPYVLAGVFAADAVATGDAGLVVDAGAWLACWGFVPYLVIVAVLPHLLPGGRVEGRGWNRYVVAMTGLIGFGALGAMFADRAADASDLLVNPLAVDHPLPLAAMGVAGFGSFTIGGPVSVASLIVRFRSVTGVDRARHGWILFGVVGFVVLALFSLPFGASLIGEVLLGVGLVFVPVATAIAVVRHRLFDIEVVLNRAIVYGVATAMVLATYALVVAVAGDVAEGTGWALPFIALTALVAAGATTRLQRAVDRLLHGQARDPYAVVTRTGERLEGISDPLAALTVLCDEVRGLLKVPWASVVPAEPALPTVSSGVEGEHYHFLPLQAYGDVVGEFRIGHRQPGEALRRADRAAWSEVARRAATLVWSARLVDELRRSRDEAQRRGELVVIAREEERRRVRRDLHDGVGPELAGIALQLQRLVRRLDDPALAEQAVALQEQLRGTVAVVRGIVDGLGPPALAELGLAGALRSHALVGDSDGPAVDVRIGEVEGLSAAVQVAAYRIATEALTNARRHADATHIAVEVDRTDGWLRIQVSDDGRGIDFEAGEGVGMASIRDRAAELGGSVEVSTAPGVGSTITAMIPEGPA